MKATISPQRKAPPERTRFKLDGRSVTLDSRIHAARGDLADVSLAGVLFSAHYARAVELTCVAAGAAILSAPSATATAVSELLRGESFHALDVTTDWTWGFCGHDGYVGYVRREALDTHEETNHRIFAGTAPLFSAPDIKAPIADYWPGGALFKGEAQGDFLMCSDGYIHRRHAVASDALESDWVAVATRYLGQPYVWGGRGHRGVDCSGLVQVALGQCGVNAPRDTDLQREGIGSPLPEDAPSQRGDLVFFPGHVGIMADEQNLLHANAYWMAVVIEPLADVVARLADDHAHPIIARRRISA
ncbi:glycoside hydrolase [Sphingobium quisquiliarum P25]|uniref:Glycoside hydrolase n=1 Tax=Sphingobium quisquiliarum P25 TaxID=1329909 RepID=T0ICP6_9SPHN|nr:NlpC/P60 family protein [Sphingobium quisquiliarum]EQB07374.1 glycoside hydrolase [Sphingobium quisquiliarum P25]